MPPRSPEKHRGLRTVVIAMREGTSDSIGFGLSSNLLQAHRILRLVRHRQPQIRRGNSGFGRWKESGSSGLKQTHSDRRAQFLGHTLLRCSKIDGALARALICVNLKPLHAGRDPRAAAVSVIFHPAFAPGQMLLATGYFCPVAGAGAGPSPTAELAPALPKPPTMEHQAETCERPATVTA